MLNCYYNYHYCYHDYQGRDDLTDAVHMSGDRHGDLQKNER